MAKQQIFVDGTQEVNYYSQMKKKNWKVQQLQKSAIITWCRQIESEQQMDEKLEMGTGDRER